MIKDQETDMVQEMPMVYPVEKGGFYSPGSSSQKSSLETDIWESSAGSWELGR